MSNEIWKFPIGHGASLMLPAGGKVLHAGFQNGEICLWVLVDTSASTELREFVVYGTGINISDADKLEHLNTLILEGGFLVLHVFEITIKEQS